MADAQPNATAILYAGWAPLGFLLVFELLLQQRRAEVSLVTEPVAVIDGLRAELAQARCDLATHQVSPVISPARQAESHQPIRQVTSASLTPGEQAKPADTAGPVVTPQPARPVAPKPPAPELVKRARPLLAKEALGREALAKKLGCTSHQAR